MPPTVPPLRPDVLTHEAYRAQRYFPALDGVRAVAILLVFTIHVQYQELWHVLAGGNGVTVFFVLSGYLITTLSLREESARGRVSLRSFYVRRVFRIYPTYFAVLAFYCLLVYGAGLQPERRAEFTDQLPWYVLFVPEHGYYSHDGALGAGAPFSGAWSIGVEEKFYLVWPVLGFVLLRHRFGARVAATAVAALAFALAPVAVPFGDYLGPYLFITLGCTVALLLHSERWFPRLVVLGTDRLLVALMLGFVVLQGLIGTGTVTGRGIDVVLGVVIALALAGVAVSTGRATGWLRSRPAVFLGKISYVFYLVHNFPLNVVEKTPLGRPGVLWSLADVVVALTVTVIGSWVVHVVLERPLTRYGHALAGRRKPFHDLSPTPAPASGSSAG